MYDGTAATNKADQVRRGRHAFGARVNTAKLAEADVLAIRAAWCQLPQPSKRELGRRYGVTGENIAAIVRGETWKHLRG